MPALALTPRAHAIRQPMSSAQPEKSHHLASPAPPVTPARSARLLRAAAARQVLRGVSAQPLSAAVQHAEQAALSRRQQAERCRVANLSGLWRKDWNASDSMEATVEAMELPWIMRKALRLVSELQIRHDEAEFATTLRAGIINVAETYSLQGELRTHPRRDLRAGQSRGLAAALAPSDAAAAEEAAPAAVVRVTTEWDEPFGGVATETFALSGDGGRTLTVDTSMQFKARPGSFAYRTVYRRG